MLSNNGTTNSKGIPTIDNSLKLNTLVLLLSIPVRTINKLLRIGTNKINVSNSAFDFFIFWNK